MKNKEIQSPNSSSIKRNKETKTIAIMSKQQNNKKNSHFSKKSKI